MKKLRSGNSYYLNKDEFSSTTAEALWRKLTEYVAKSVSNAASVSYDSRKYIIDISTSDKMAASGIVIPDEASLQLDFNLNRTMFLNACFDKNSKSTVISNDNMSEYPSGNTLQYSIQCSAEPLQKNSLFFHESALENYTTKGYTPETWSSCKDFLAMISYDVVGDTNGVLIGERRMAFLDYNETDDKVYVNTSFDVLNESADAEAINGFIAHFNNASSRHVALSTAVGSAEARNFRFATSMFKLPGKDAAHFIDFKSFVSAPIYNKFIESLIKKLA